MVTRTLYNRETDDRMNVGRIVQQVWHAHDWPWREDLQHIIAYRVHKPIWARLLSQNAWAERAKDL